MKALDKNTAVVGTVATIELLPSKNKDWDARWCVTFADGYAFYVGNKALTQQLGRLRMNPTDLVRKHLGFERTEEGYLNIIVDAESFRPGTKVVHGGGSKPAHDEVPNPNRFDGDRLPFDDDEDVPTPATDPMASARAGAVAAMSWAMDEASRIIRVYAGVEEGEATPPELMRSIVALAATLHITVKEKAHGR
jgi:hypothetical protein